MAAVDNADSRHHGAFPLGTVLLHRFNGDEVFRIRSATISAAQVDETTRLSFAVKSDEEPIQALSDTAELNAHPSAKATVILDQFDLDTLIGQRFSVPFGYDETIEDHIATIYYCEHEDLDNNVIEVLGRDGCTFHIRWTGTTVDVNYYDGSKPDTTVVIEGYFTFISAGAY